MLEIGSLLDGQLEIPARIIRKPECMCTLMQNAKSKENNAQNKIQKAERKTLQCVKIVAKRHACDARRIRNTFLRYIYGKTTTNRTQ